MARLMRIGMAALAAVALVTGIAGEAQAKKKKNKDWLQWSVPFTCGVNDGEVFRAVPGEYAVAVNILNTEDADVMFTKHLALTFPPSTQDPGAVSDPVIETLPAGSALQVDCGEILGTDFFPVPPGEAYVQGFLVVRAHAQLEVALTQTATSGVGGEVSVDVEKVESRIVDGHGLETGKGDKIAVCHVPPGNPAAKHTIYVDAPAVPAHLGHGDYLGDCE